ncbi:MAG: LuxR C-terminal-related transcriptional regulator, partial [bacterium]
MAVGARQGVDPAVGRGFQPVDRRGASAEGGDEGCRGNRAAPGGLTSREVEVLARIAAGASNRDVAKQLFISD